MSEENANYVRTEIKVYYQHDIDKLQAENKRLREVIKDIKFEAEFNGNDESVQKMFMIAKQALGE